MADGRLRALDEAGDRIAPDAIGWTGIEDFHDRCYVHYFHRAIDSELSLRGMKLSVVPDEDEADFGV